jgi:t-SNARE complex subunit (syntaxin)
MAAQGDLDNDLAVHRRGYEKFITAFRVSAVICFIIAFIVILVIAK